MDREIGGIADLLGSSQDRQINGAGVATKEEILANYDFHPIRRSELESSPPASLDDGKSWTAREATSRISNFGVQESSKHNEERSRDSHETVNISAIDGTVKKYVDILMRAVEGISSRVSQLESRTRNLEHALDELKSSIGSIHGATNGKLRQLDHDLREVKTGLQFICDKQEIVEAQSQLSKLETKGDNPPPLDNSSSPPTQYSLPPQPPSTHQLPAQPLSAPQLPAQPPAPNAPPQIQLVHQNPPVQYSEVQPPPQQYFLPPQQTQMAGQPFPSPYQQPLMPPQQPREQPSPSTYPVTQPPQLPAQPSFTPQLPAQPPAPNAPQLQLAHQNPPSQYSEFQHYPLQHHQNQLPAQPFPFPPQQPEEPPSPSTYMPSPQTYPVNQPPQPLARPALPYQIYGSATSQPPGQQHYGPAFSDPYPPPPGPARPILPTAQLLPQAQPDAAESGSSSGPSAKRVPVDDVVDRVTAMGFPRDLVRETVKRMTENGQSVDLNVVLDKLMNGQENQPRKGWFGQG